MKISSAPEHHHAANRLSLPLWVRSWPCRNGRTAAQSMKPENEAKLWRRIAAAGNAAIAKNGYATAIDALLGTGWLQPDKVEDWRRGRVPYLEQVTVASLPKISTAMRIFRRWAHSAGLRPSETVYVSWTRDRRPLRFSKSGDPKIERTYRTHWLPPKPNATTNRGSD
jgi:hypothetical protein